MTINDPFEAIEIQFSADNVSVAADEVPLVAETQLRVEDAIKSSREASSDSERLAAELKLQRAHKDHIAYVATSSRVTWELNNILDSDI